MVILGTSSGSVLEIARLRERASPLAHVLLDLLGEAIDQRLDGADRRVAQGAQRLAADVLADGEQKLGVALRPLAVLQAVQHQLHPVRPLAAGSALAARFMI